MAAGPRSIRQGGPDPAAAAVGILLGVAAAAAIAYVLGRALGGDRDRCPECGAFVAEGAARCRNCGRRL